MFNATIPSEITVEIPTDGIEIQISAGEQGPPGSQDLNVKSVLSAPVTVIDYLQGSYQNLILQGNVDTLSVINFPAAGKAARLILQVTNEGNFAINGWPSGTLWSGGGGAPVVTPGANKLDIYVLTTGPGGLPIFGNIVGQDYQ